MTDFKRNVWNQKGDLICRSPSFERVSRTTENSCLILENFREILKGWLLVGQHSGIKAFQAMRHLSNLLNLRVINAIYVVTFTFTTY